MGTFLIVFCIFCVVLVGTGITLGILYAPTSTISPTPTPVIIPYITPVITPVPTIIPPVVDPVDLQSYTLKTDRIVYTSTQNIYDQVTIQKDAKMYSLFFVGSVRSQFIDCGMHVVEILRPNGIPLRTLVYYCRQQPSTASFEFGRNYPGGIDIPAGGTIRAYIQSTEDGCTVVVDYATVTISLVP